MPEKIQGGSIGKSALLYQSCRKFKSRPVQMTFVSFCNNSIQYHSHEVFKMYLINVWKLTINIILYSVVVFTLTFWVRDLGSIPLQHYFVFFWKNNQTLRAKITLFPRKDFFKNLRGHSDSIKLSFKAIKSMVGPKVTWPKLLSEKSWLC